MAEARTRLDWQEAYARLERPLAEAPPAVAGLDLEALAREPQIIVDEDVG